MSMFLSRLQGQTHSAGNWHLNSRYLSFPETKKTNSEIEGEEEREVAAGNDP